LTRKLKPLEIELSDSVREAILELPVQASEGLTNVGCILKQARSALDTVNEVVRENALIQLTANHLMRTHKRRGTPTIEVRLDGTVVLVVHYPDGVEDAQPPSPAKLPTLETLRALALEAGIDISDLGRQKINIMRRLGLDPGR